MFILLMHPANLAKPANAIDLKSIVERLIGSTPIVRTMKGNSDVECLPEEEKVEESRASPSTMAISSIVEHLPYMQRARARNLHCQPGNLGERLNRILC